MLHTRYLLYMYRVRSWRHCPARRYRKVTIGHYSNVLRLVYFLRVSRCVRRKALGVHVKKRGIVYHKPMWGIIILYPITLVRNHIIQANIIVRKKNSPHLLLRIIWLRNEGKTKKKGMRQDKSWVNLDRLFWQQRWEGGMTKTRDKDKGRRQIKAKAGRGWDELLAMGDWVICTPMYI